jgi:hypothetical protein
MNYHHGIANQTLTKPQGMTKMRKSKLRQAARVKHIINISLLLLGLLFSSTVIGHPPGLQSAAFLLEVNPSCELNLSSYRGGARP